MREFKIGTEHLSINDITGIIEGDIKLSLSRESRENIINCRSYLEKKLEESDEPIYGVNTGFGSLYNKIIPKSDLGSLQENLVMSHASGMGEKVPSEIVRLMLLLKVKGMCYGKSAIRIETVLRLIDMYNEGIYPVIYEQGSLGASGDLAPLAHLSLPLIGKGEVDYKGKRLSGKEINEKMGWKPLELGSKEGLALLNGTQLMSAYCVHMLMKLNNLNPLADLIASISLDAFDGRLDPFDELIHKARPHKGQLNTAENIRKNLEGSELITRPKKHIQDPYSFRCIPQVHGASKDAVSHIARTVETEINSVTDNPTVFPEQDKIISGGNFHGQPLAISLDFLAIAVSELSSISERRIYKLVSGQRGLPDFLVASPGLNSGLMIPQYTAASAVSQNKQLCTPSSVDTVDSSNGQEDHVSMGANSATKCLKVLENLEKVLSIELFCAAQALDFRRPEKSSPEIEKLIKRYREKVPFVEKDREFYKDMKISRFFLQSLKV